MDRINGWAEILQRLGDPGAGVRPTMFIHRRCARLLDCLTGNHTTFELENDPVLVASLAIHLHQHVTRLGLCDETGRIRLTKTEHGQEMPHDPREQRDSDQGHHEAHHEGDDLEGRHGGHSSGR